MYASWNPHEPQPALVAVRARYFSKLALHLLRGQGLSLYENELIKVRFPQLAVLDELADPQL